MPAAGDPAPDFTLPRDGGGSLTLSALRPGKVVLFFYPKDSTATCTLEAQDFTARLEDFRAAGATVVGVSKDSVASHDRFRRKSGLGVTLASDATGEVCEAWGVWGEKQLYGRRYMGIERTTFLIAGDGRIARVWPKVSVKGHADEVLAAVRTL